MKSHPGLTEMGVLQPGQVERYSLISINEVRLFEEEVAARVEDIREQVNKMKSS